MEVDWEEYPREKPEPKYPPPEDTDCFLRETTYVLASSAMQVPSSFDFQQTRQ